MEADQLWYVPCPSGFEIGPWREACAEIAEACGEVDLPFHSEDLNRLLVEATRVVSSCGPGQDGVSLE